MATKFPITNITVPERGAVRITFAESDGAFEVHFNTTEHWNQIFVKETDGMPGSLKGRANELLYIEDFGYVNADGRIKDFNECYTPEQLWEAVYAVIPGFREARAQNVYLNLPACLRNAAEDLFIFGDHGKEETANFIRKALLDLAQNGEFNYEKA